MANSSYFPHTSEDIQKMLQKVGLKSLDDLYVDVPQKYIFNKESALAPAMSEHEVRSLFANLDNENKKLKVFVGAGAYDHYTPSVVPYIISRSEFLTAYTPYQPEIAQGTLRYIFEYQSIIAELTGLDVSNASMYDGATAAAEAARMAIACTKKKTKVLLSKSLLPNVIELVQTYAKFNGIQLDYVELENGQTSIDDLKLKLGSNDVAGLIVPAVNRYGIIEDLSGVADLVHAQSALVIEYCDPSALAVVKSPGEWGFDIAVGDAQSLGLPLNFGGPYIGFIVCKKEYVRKMPGRIAGETVDSEGRRCFVLTLQAREQHIKREKATSNICSNQSLLALFVTIYTSLMGAKGLEEVNNLSYSATHYLYDRLLETGKFEAVFPNRPFLKEFVLKPLVDQKLLQEHLLEAGFFAALPTEEGYVSFCATEKRTKEEIDELISVIKEV